MTTASYARRKVFGFDGPHMIQLHLHRHETIALGIELRDAEARALKEVATLTHLSQDDERALDDARFARMPGDAGRTLSQMLRSPDSPVRSSSTRPW